MKEIRIEKLKLMRKLRDFKSVNITAKKSIDRSNYEEIEKLKKKIDFYDRIIKEVEGI